MLMGITVSCTQWVLPENCNEPTPTEIEYTTINNIVTCKTNNLLANWSLVNSNGSIVKVLNSSASFTFGTYDFPNGNYQIKAIGNTACNFNFNLQKTYTVSCNETVPSEITYTIVNGVVTCKSGTSTGNWNLVNALGVAVKTLNNSQQFIFGVNDFPEGDYQIKVGGTTSCLVKFELKKDYNLFFEMVQIDGGTYQMGDVLASTDVKFGITKANELPVHAVTLSSYRLGKYEITQKLWKMVVGSLPTQSYTCDLCPITNISWDDCQIFIDKLNVLTNSKYRMPTEAQWEFAARERGKTVRFGNGKNILNYLEANFNAEYSISDQISSPGNTPFRIVPIGTYKPNALGLYDMTGNVSEWCIDWLRNYEPYSAVDPDFSSGYLGQYKITRGGHHGQFGHEIRVFKREDSFVPTFKGSGLGLRIASPL